MNLVALQRAMHLPPAHYAEAPLDTYRQFIAQVDAFGGSGMTLTGTEKMGCAARLIELDPKYVDVIVRRWQEWTGELAT